MAAIRHGCLWKVTDTNNGNTEVMRMCLGRMKAWPFLTGPSGGGVEVVETSYFQGQVWPGMVGGEPQCACAVSALLLPAGWAYTLTLSNYLSHISPPHHRSQPQQHQQKIVSFHQNFPQEKTQQYQEYSWNLSVFWLFDYIIKCLWCLLFKYFLNPFLVTTWYGGKLLSVSER